MPGVFEDSVWLEQRSRGKSEESKAEGDRVRSHGVLAAFVGVLS